MTASFPTSIKTFTTLLDDIDDVLASHQNDRGDEITAIEKYLINHTGRISVTVASNNITVAIKTLAGSDPSASDPVYVRIGNTLRAITAATSVTKNAGTNWFNAGGSELATKEIDYFVYLIWNTTPATDIVDIGFARKSFYGVYSDFSGTSTSENYLAFGNASTPTSTDDCVVIGRFAATLSAGAGYTWSVPTFNSDNLKQYPIYETRWLDWTPAYGGAGGLTLTGTPTTAVAKYKFDANNCYVQVRVSAFTVNVAGTIITNTLPMDAVNDFQFVGGMLSVDSGGTAFGGTRINFGTPDTMYWLKYNASNFASGAGTALNCTGFYQI